MGAEVEDTGMQTLVQLAAALGAELAQGKSRTADTPVTGVNSIAAATAEQLVFAEDAATLNEAIQSKAAAVITSPKLATDAFGDKPLLIATQPKLAFARAARVLRAPDAPSGIHVAAVVADTAILGEGVSIEACAVVEAGARIGEGTRIGAGAVIGAGVVMGAGCRIYPRVVIYSSVTLGDRVIVHAGAVLGADGFGYVRDASNGTYTQFPQQGTLVLEDDVEVGANTTIDRGALAETRIGRGVKLDNLIHIGHNCTVGHDVVIAAQTGISGSCSIGANAIVGGQIGMGDHAEIGAGVIVGSGAGILPHKRLKQTGVVYWGTPAKPLKQYLRELAALSRLAKSSKETEDTED